MKKTISIFLTTVCCIVIWIPFVAASNADDIAIVSQNSDGIRFQYTPLNLKQSKIYVRGKPNIRYHFKDASVFTQPGEPAIPVRTVVFAVPPGSEVSAAITARDFDLESNIHLLPVPFVQQNGDIPQLDYPEIYQLTTDSQFFPKNILRIEGPSFYGDVQIVRVHIAPVQYHPEKRIARLYSHLEIRLNFTASRQAAELLSAERLKFRDQSILRAVENSEQARRWIRSRSRPTLRKRLDYFGDSDYYKIPIETEGLYRITGEFLQDQGIDISTIDPATIKIYNNGGRVLPRSLTTPRPDSLIENAIRVVDGGDDQFDESDYILFYGSGVTGWEYSPENERFSHYINPYTHKNIYWLTFNDGREGKRMEAAQKTEGSVNNVTAYRAKSYIENEIWNIYESGIVWFGTEFSSEIREESYTLTLSNLRSSNHIHLRGRMFSTSGNVHRFQFLLDGKSIGGINFYGHQKYDFEIDSAMTVSDGSHKLDIRYTPSSQVSVAYLDWIEISAEASLRLKENYLTFYGAMGSQAVEYRISGASGENYQVFDITHFSDLKEIEDVTIENGKIIFRSEQGTTIPKRYMVVGVDRIRPVSSIEKDEYSNWHDPSRGGDFIIITHNDFFSPARSLKNLRESHDGLQTELVKITDVFDEFSAGLYDPTAIRDFLHYVYENWSPRPQYVLLFGDGDYDYKNIISKNDKNWMPPYESSHLSENVNRTTDDWYTYVHGSDNTMDFSIGRIPVQTTEEAEYVVDKLIEYSTDSPPGFWKNLITVVADDEITPNSKNEILHTEDAEDLAENYIPNRFDLDKIYLTEYPANYESGVAWITKPGATEDLLNRINKGSLLINYIGHGHEHLLAHERLLKDSRDLNKIKNDHYYGFWVNATCDFGRWDNPEEQSFAETLLNMKQRGAIGLLASAREAYATSNAFFNKQFIKFLFQDPRNPIRIGEAVRLAKSATYSLTNNEKYFVLGDPTLLLNVPPLNVPITELSPDSLKALSLINIKGEVLDNSNNPLGLSGQFAAKVFDSKKDVTYVAKGGSTVNYLLPGNPIFRGSGTAENGQIQLQFIVPKDISYGGQEGRISLYFNGGSQEEGIGYKDHLTVGGTATDLVDRVGPDIRFEARQQNLVDFAVLNTDDQLTITLEDDKSGINITGDVGHKVVAVPDENTANQKDITYLFEYEPNSYLCGAIKMPLSLFAEFRNADVERNTHQLSVKAWDNANNSSEEKIRFELVPSEKLSIQNVLNYPNPFLHSTTFTFDLTSEAEIDIKIFTLSGRLITHMDDVYGSFGFNTISWNARDQNGDPIANGAYLYQIKAKSENQTAEYTGKLVKMK